MLRRAGDLTTRARERIRAAREHDPHAWPVGNEDSAALMHELEAEGLAEGQDTAERTDQHTEATMAIHSARPAGSKNSA